MKLISKYNTYELFLKCSIICHTKDGSNHKVSKMMRFNCLYKGMLVMTLHSIVVV